MTKEEKIEKLQKDARVWALLGSYILAKKCWDEIDQLKG